MNASPLSHRISNLLELLNPLYQFMTNSTYVHRANEPGICDFVVGNPHEMPLPDALPPTMPEREQLRPAIFLAQMLTGYAFPNALRQHTLPDLEPLSIDVAHLQRNRMVGRLRDIGYEVNIPEGTFYLLVRSPIDDDAAFVERLAGHAVFCLPGKVAELSGYFRISLTANDAMIERSAAGFAAALKAPMG